MRLPCARCGGPRNMPSVRWCAACTEVLYHIIHPEVPPCGAAAESGGHVKITSRHRMCPACLCMVEPDADGVLPEHDSGGTLPSRCPASGWTIKGEHQ